jgi:MFS family permease
MILQAVYTSIIMLAVVPAGIVADYIGKKKVLVANAFLFSLSWLLFSLSSSFISFLIAEIIIALASAMWAASGTALFYDTLKELKKESQFKKKYGLVVTVNYIFWGIASLAGGYFAQSSLRFPFMITAVSTAIGFLIAFSLTEPKSYKHADTHYLAHLKGAIRFSSTHPKVRLFILYSSIFFTMLFIAQMFYQPYLKSIGLSLIYFGIIYFAIELIAAVGSKSASRIESFFGEKKILSIILIISIFCFFGMSQGLIIIGFLFPIILSFNGAMLEPIIQDYINKHTESHHRATVMSLNTLIQEIFSTALAPFLGYIADIWSLSTALMMSGMILCINLIILFMLFKLAKAKTDTSD